MRGCPCVASGCLLLVAFLAAAPAAAQTLPERSDRVVDYRISVTLDPAKHQLTGTQTLTWRNPSTTDAVQELQFHLYLNAFKNTKSTFMKESGGQLRQDQMAKDGWGWIDITAMSTAAGADLKPTLAFIQLDDGNTDDQTVARVTLPEPVPPGGSVTLEMRFTSKLPQVFARTGYKDDFYLVGPVVPETRRLRAGGHARTRARAAGTATSSMRTRSSTPTSAATPSTSPSRATTSSGPPASARACARMATARPRTRTTQADIHDFAWTADPDYVVVNATFSASQDVSPAEYQRVAALLGRTIDEVRLSDVDITVLLQPGHRPQAQRHIDAAKAGLKWLRAAGTAGIPTGR